jgi:hypothetical protein
MLDNFNKTLDEFEKRANALIDRALQKQRLGGGTPVAPPVNKPADTELHNSGWNGWSPEETKGFKIQMAAPSVIELDADGKVILKNKKQRD